MADAIDIVLIVLNIMNFFPHALGVYLLLELGRKNTQHIYLINLSISEFLKNLVNLLTVIPDIVSLHPNSLYIYKELHVYLGIIYDYGIMCSYILTMFYITIDRYFIILLGLRYKTFWNVTKTNYLILTTWLVGIFISLTLSLVYIWSDNQDAIGNFIGIDKREAPFVTFSRPFIGIPFIVLAIAVYYQIFRKYAKSQEKINYCKQNQTRFAIFAHSRFFIPVLLIASFLTFTVIPDLIFSYHQLTNKNVSHTLQVLCYVFYSCSDLADAFIYVLVQTKVRKLLNKKLHRIYHCCRDNKYSRKEELQHFLPLSSSQIKSIQFSYHATTYV